MTAQSMKGVGIAMLAVAISGVAAAFSISRAVSPPAISPAAQTTMKASGGCNGCGSGEGESSIAAAAGLSGDAAVRMAQMENEIAGRARATLEDAEFLHECAHGTDDVFVQRWAIALASDRLATNRCDENARATMERVIIDALSHDNWRVRRTGLATSEESGLTAREDVATRIREMRDDERPEVAARASYVRLPGDPPLSSEQK